MLAFALLLIAGDAGCKEATLGQRNYHVRIAIQKNVDRVAIEPRGSYQVVDPKGLAVTTLKSGEMYFVDIVRGRSTGVVYRLVVRELDSHQEENAVTLARAARSAYGLPGKALRLPAPTEEGGSRLLVTVGEFNTLPEARAYREKIGAEKIEQIFEEKTPAREGNIIIHDARGRTLAANGEILRIIPLDLAGNSLFVHKIDAKQRVTQAELEGSRHYRGQIGLAMDEEGALTVVNTLWIEYYLYGVVAAEIGNTAPIESLRAQAVVARSEAVAKIERGIVSPSPLYDFTDSALIQAYKGKGEESESVRDAVDSTRGEILVWKGRAVDAVYSHSCGGVLASATDMWDDPSQDYSKRKADRLENPWIGELSDASAARQWTARNVDSFCNPSHPGFPDYAKKSFRWTKEFTSLQLDSFFNSKYGTGHVKDIKVTRRMPSGRVRGLAIFGEKKTVTLERELAVREAFGGLKSTFFTIDNEYEGEGQITQLTLYGAGYGHGVGLCQMGAYVMGLEKYTYRQILGHYFSNVKIRRLYG